MVTPGYYPIKGGTEAVVQNLSMELNRIGVHTDVMTFNMDQKWNPRWRGKTEIINGVTIFKIPGLNWFPLEHSPRITMGVNLIPGRFRNILKQYDVVHFHEDLSFPFFSFFLRKPKIFHEHGLNVGMLKRYRLHRSLFKHVADLYIVLSKQQEENLFEMGITKNKILRLPNGVDTNLFIPTGKKEENLILFVGRVAFNKGVHVLIESLHHLKTPVRLVIIGPPWELDYYQELQKLAEKEKREGKHEIIFLGALDHSDVVQWYQKASIFVLPSFYEAFPVVMLEALSCETPLISTPVGSGGISEVIRNYKNGILVPKNDAIKLAEAIQYLLDNKEIRTKLGKAGRKTVTKEYSLKVVGKQLSEIYYRISNQ